MVRATTGSWTVAMTRNRPPQRGQARASRSNSAGVFLAFGDAGYVVAHALNVDGGNWMS